MYKHAAAVFCRVARYSAVSHCKCGVFINKYTAAVDRRRVARYLTVCHRKRAGEHKHTAATPRDIARYRAAVHRKRAVHAHAAAVATVSAGDYTARDNARFRACGFCGKLAVIERPKSAFRDVIVMLTFLICRLTVIERQRRARAYGYHTARTRACELVAVKTQRDGRAFRNRYIGSQRNVACKIIIAALKRAACCRQFRPRSVGVVVNGRFGFPLRRKSGRNGQTYRKHNRNA